MKKIETIEEMLLFLKKSKEGERAEYYRGFLFTDRQVIPKNDKARDRVTVADIAWKAYEQSRGTLVQKRNGPDDYSYIFQSYGHGHKMGIV